MAASFTPRWRAEARGFAPWAGRVDADASQAQPQSAADDPWQIGYAAGVADAETLAAGEAAHGARLAQALEQLRPVATPLLAEQLSAGIEATLRALVGSASIDENLLQERAAALAALVAGDAPPVLEAHTEDAALLADLAADAGLVLKVCDRLPRGELRLIDGATMLATGPHSLLDTLYERGGGEA